MFSRHGEYVLPGRAEASTLTSNESAGPSPPQQHSKSDAGQDDYYDDFLKDGFSLEELNQGKQRALNYCNLPSSFVSQEGIEQ